METKIELNDEEWGRLQRALRGEDGWEPNEELKKASANFKRALVDGRIKVEPHDG